jgi:dipeptide/tripeptide permease
MSKRIFENQKELFGHPAGLYVLFFTEMWERFSYYGMRAILSLYMARSLADANPGLGYDAGTSLAIYGWYTMLVYVVSIPGGILADKFIGQKRSVFLGGLTLVVGQSILAVDSIYAFYTGSGPDHPGRGGPQAQYLHHGRGALQTGRHSPGPGFYHLLHWDQRRGLPGVGDCGICG